MMWRESVCRVGGGVVHQFAYSHFTLFSLRQEVETFGLKWITDPETDHRLTFLFAPVFHCESEPKMVLLNVAGKNTHTFKFSPINLKNDDNHVN